MLLTYDEFKERLIEELETSIPEQMELSCATVTKNNGQRLEGIGIAIKGQDLAQQFYFDDLYKRHTDESDVKIAAECIIRNCRRNDVIGMEIAEKLLDFNSIKDCLCIKIVNRSKNAEMLESAPHIDFLDLAAIFYIRMGSDREFYSVTVNDNLMAKWDKKKEDIIKLAGQNTRALDPAKVRKISEVVDGFGMPGTDTEAVLDNILTIGSQSERFGAVYMLDKKLLAGLAEKLGDNLVLIPSSIHEILAAPASDVDPPYINRIIKEVNSTCLEPVDYLSDHAYIFYKDECELGLCE